MTAPQNLPVLYRNIMDGLPNDFARDAFLWATERTTGDPFLYKAEAFAREAEKLAAAFAGLVDLRQKQTLRDGGPLLNEAQEGNLVEFVMKRHANWRFKGNVTGLWFDAHPQGGDLTCSY